MIQAYLYTRDGNQLRELDAAGVLATAPPDAACSEAAPSDIVPLVEARTAPVEKQALVPHEATPENGKNNDGFVQAKPHCRDGELLWIDITAPDEEDYELLVKRFSLHPMVIEDIKAREDRPKLHDYGEYLYVIFHALRFENTSSDGSLSSTRDALRLCEIDCLIGPDYVVTLHREPIEPFNDLRKRWMRRPELMHGGTAYLLYELMDEVLDEYFPVLDALDDRIDSFEDRLFLEFQEHLSADIFALKRCLLQVRRIAGPTRDVANVLLRRDAETGGKHFAYFQDLYDHSVRIVDMVDTFRDILSGALDAYLAIASNRMNSVMKTLTSWSIILLVPTLVAGIYGMNFENMPELKTRYGYYVVLGVMAALITALTIYFKRKKWF